MKKQASINSNELKSKMGKAIFAISCFAITYLTLLIFAISLTGLCFYAAYLIHGLSFHYLAIIVGFGIASIGVFVLIFLLKFTFSVQRPDRSFLKEIFSDEEPELFSLISEVSEKVGASFPKRVYLSADVTAMVFYNSSFWSMFLPVRKNLSIGMGLINSVSREELKAILAHEFGHFAQGSMLMGSYVYNVNQILFNLLHNNQPYENFIAQWSVRWRSMEFFARTAFFIIKRIQDILQILYRFVNTSYLSLSREMEFQADAVAAELTGAEPLKNALLRLELADFAFKNTLAFYEERLDECKKSVNIYADHTFVLKYLATKSQLSIVNGFPLLTLQDLNKYNTSKLVIEDQWASHPSTADRIERLEQLNSKRQKVDQRPALSIFRNSKERSASMTDFLFSSISFEKNPELIQTSDFALQYENDIERNSFPDIYMGYYDEKNPSLFDLTICADTPSASLSELFSDERVKTISRANGLKNDIAFLEQLGHDQIDLKSFHYDSERFLKTDAKDLASRLKKELEFIENKILGWDIAVFLTFKAVADEEQAVQLVDLYQDLFDFDRNFEEHVELFNELNMDLQFMSKVHHDYEIVDNFEEIGKKESVLKENIQELLANELLMTDLKTSIIESLEMYLSKDWVYFDGDNYNNTGLEVLSKGLNAFQYASARLCFLKKKRLLDFQYSIYQKSGKEIPSE